MWKYVGDPAETRGVVGLPAYDISDEEAEERGIVEALKASPLYRHTKDSPALAAGEE